MSAAIAAVVVGVAGIGVGMASASAANKAADQRAEDANFANTQAASRSRDLAAQNAKNRKAELLRRFDIKSGKMKDSNQQINMGLATKLTSFELAYQKASSVTDNALATKHITGRLANRMRSAQAVQASMSKSGLIQAGEQSHREIGSKLESLLMNKETEDSGIDVDLSNSINGANNQEVKGWTASTSSGSLGVANAAIGGLAQGLSMYSSAAGAYNSYKAGTVSTGTAPAVNTGA